MQLPDALSGVGPPDPPRSHDVPASRLARFLNWMRRCERELWFAVVAAMLIDVTLTVHGLALGLSERNPVANRAIAAFGVIGLYALKSLALAVAVCCRAALPPRHRPLVPLGLGVPSVLAVGINAVVIAVAVF